MVGVVLQYTVNSTTLIYSKCLYNFIQLKQLTLVIQHTYVPSGQVEWNLWIWLRTEKLRDCRFPFYLAKGLKGLSTVQNLCSVWNYEGIIFLMIILKGCRNWRDSRSNGFAGTSPLIWKTAAGSVWLCVPKDAWCNGFSVGLCVSLFPIQ